MTSAIFASFWVFYLIGDVLWAYVGTLAASSRRLPLWLGALAGGVFWLPGAAVVYLVGIGRDVAARRRFVSPAAAPNAGIPYGSSLAGPGPSPSPAFFATSSPTIAGPDPWGPAPWSSAAGAPLAASAQPSAPVRSAAGARSHLPAAVPCVLAAGMVAAVALPWGYGVVAWSKDARASGAIGPTSFAPAAVLLVISAAAVATAALLHERFPRGLWLGAAAIVCTFWFTLLIEWLVVSHDADAASRAFQSVSGKPAYASLGNAGGAWLMLACCCGVYAWVAWQTVRLVRSRNSLPPAASSMPTGGPVAPW